jgi:hypothetical protein
MSITNCLQTRKSTETAMHHVIIHIQEADNMIVSLELSSILRELLIVLHVTLQGLSHSMAWRHSLSMSWLHAGWLKIYSHAQRRHSGVVCGQGLSADGYFINPQL